MPQDKLEEFTKKLFYILDRAHTCHYVKIAKWDIEALIKEYTKPPHTP